jgi:hypothetical protein
MKNYRKYKKENRLDNVCFLDRLSILGKTIYTLVFLSILLFVQQIYVHGIEWLKTVSYFLMQTTFEFAISFIIAWLLDSLVRGCISIYKECNTSSAYGYQKDKSNFFKKYMAAIVLSVWVIVKFVLSSDINTVLSNPLYIFK